MGVVDVSINYKELERIINLGKEEMDKQAEKWGVVGENINDIIDKLPL